MVAQAANEGDDLFPRLAQGFHAHDLAADVNGDGNTDMLIAWGGGSLLLVTITVPVLLQSFREQTFLEFLQRLWNFCSTGFAISAVLCNFCKACCQTVFSIPE